VLRLDFYSDEAMEEIVVRSATVLDVPISQEGARALARRARGTPRVANRLLKRARDFAEVRGQGSITDQIAAEALAMLDIDHLGLDDIDRRILRSIVEKFGGGPVGIDTLAAAISEETDTLMDVYEPYLIQLGFLQRTPRGRIATEGAYTHLGIAAPALFNRQPALFGGAKG
jgi:holliday junction DNA helicase RuvB